MGAGPNGLAAIHLARNGFDVQVLEAADSIGGGARSGELTVPPVIHDHCSAAHPFGVGSAFWKLIDLERYGLTWKWPEIDCAPTVSKSTGELEAYNLNYIGGANNRLRVLFRPRMAIDPYFTGVPGVYLCSQSTPPGAGIHGLCGYHAAQSALRRIRKRPV